eukprot:14679-Prymnesium_polylepis.1
MLGLDQLGRQVGHVRGTGRAAPTAVSVRVAHCVASASDGRCGPRLRRMASPFTTARGASGAGARTCRSPPDLRLENMRTDGRPDRRRGDVP